MIMMLATLTKIELSHLEIAKRNGDKTAWALSDAKLNLINCTPSIISRHFFLNRNTVSYLRNNRAVSWLGIEPATESRKP